MIAHLKKQITGAKSELPVRIRPIGAKWQQATAVGADEKGIAVTWPNGVAGYMPWSAIAVLNVVSEEEAKKAKAKAK